MAEVLLSAPPQDKLALVSDKRLTYGELRERVHRLSNGLNSLGIGEGKKVAVMLYNTNEFIESVLAAQILGALPVPINWHLKGDEVSYMIENCDAELLICDKDFVGRSESIEIEKLVAGEKYEELLRKSSSEKPEKIFHPSLMIYSSGTTGRPKGIDWSILFETLLSYSKMEKEERKYASGMLTSFTLGFGWHRTSKVHLVAAPLYHAAPLTFALITLMLRGTLVMLKRFDARKALSLIQEEKISTAFMPPILLKRILDVDDKESYDISSMKSLICAGAPCPVKLKKGAIRYFGPVFYEFYGSSETAVNTILSPKDYLSNPEKIKSVGKPAPGNFLKIIDEDGKECPPRVPGELCVMNILTRRLQYYKDPEKTRKSFVEIDGEKYYMEGEVAYRDEDGYLYIVDRKKDIIISGGVNIYPGEIEEVICSYPKVEDAAVIGVPDEEWGESIKALIVPKKGEEIGREEIILYCREKLAGYKKPKYVEFVEELPRSPDGKLLKRELRDRYRK